MYVEEALFTSPRAKSQGGGGGGKAWDIRKLHFVRMDVCMYVLYCALTSACEATGRAQYSHVVDCNLKNKNKKKLFFFQFFFSIFHSDPLSSGICCVFASSYSNFSTPFPLKNQKSKETYIPRVSKRKAPRAGNTSR